VTAAARHTVRVDLGEQSYDIEIGTGILDEAGSFVAERCRLTTAFVVTDENLETTHAPLVCHSLADAGGEVEMLVVDAGEPSKCIEVANELWNMLLETGADRHSIVVAVGGGVVGDLAGFVAATFARGVPFLQVPTTLLAQVDSSVGGKVGINLPDAKNMVGAFWQPRGVLIDTDVLNTLPEREYRAGMAEVVKYGVVLDAEFFAYLEEHATDLIERRGEVLRHVVTRSCQLKAEVVSADPHERTGRRSVLNYGHTFAHALETVAGYGELLHGEAVAMGMMCAARLAEGAGRVDAPFVERQKALPADRLAGGRSREAHRSHAARQEGRTWPAAVRAARPARLRGACRRHRRSPSARGPARIAPMNAAPPGDPGRTNDLADELRLTLVDGVGPRIRMALLERFGSSAAVLAAPPSELRTVPGVGPKLAPRIAAARDEIDAAGELALCREHGIALLSERDDAYPRLLKEIPDPPGILFARGEILPQDALAVAIVGTRHASPYGLKMADQLAQSLARAGLTIVSGLARGIDAAAHRGALAAGGRTIAVLASGLLVIYPPEHEQLAREIAGRGALVSESAPRTCPIGGAFPQRNRIISGMCLGVIVVEAAERSGALITARHAMEQGREVFAVPGRVDQRGSRGCHRLIRDGARLVETADDVLAELGPLVAPAARLDGGEIRHPAELQLNDAERQVLDAIDSEATSIDTVVATSGLPVPSVLSTVSVLEMRRLVRRLSGNFVARY
jgi:DNA processing protein